MCIYICSSSLSLSVLQLELIDIHFYSLLNQLPRYPCAINTYTRKKQVIQRWRITCNDERTPYSNNRLWTLYLCIWWERKKKKKKKFVFRNVHSLIAYQKSSSFRILLVPFCCYFRCSLNVSTSNLKITPTQWRARG